MMQAKTYNSLANFDAILPKLKELISNEIRPIADFEIQWNLVVTSFKTWLQRLPATVSPLVQNLEFLRRLEEVFQTRAFSKNSEISEVLLSGTVKPGERLILRGEDWVVLSRVISNNYGVEFTLSNKKGKIMRQEFFE
jgi:hypothetical protein